jgi:Ser/Thr protein kinase RdoA (MazF antagonist)
VPRLFVKHADRVRSGGRDLASEAAVYRLARTSPELAPVVPRCAWIGPGDSPIVLEAIAGAPLSAAPPVLGGPRAPRLLHGYARAVARAHRVRPPPFGDPPWLFLSLEPGLADHRLLPEPCRRLLSRLAVTPGVREAFRRAASAWRPEGLIHGDLRWANALADERRGAPAVRLIDWELACAGDPAWDLASVLADVLATLALAGRGDALVPDAERAAGVFLRAYRAESAAGRDRWPALVARATAMVGARLVQTLVEYASVSAAHLAAVEPVLLPVALRWLRGPDALGRRVARSAQEGAAT